MLLMALFAMGTACGSILEKEETSVKLENRMNDMEGRHQKIGYIASALIRASVVVLSCGDRIHADSENFEAVLLQAFALSRHRTDARQ